ncbi:MAG: hypothetical protein HOV68_00040, partial [Streptomycetaceae bacterium]|nr:hypothetical protein [Streptomycetaceae bacterium]
APPAHLGPQYPPFGTDPGGSGTGGDSGGGFRTVPDYDAPPPRHSRKPLVLGVVALVIALIAAAVAITFVLRGNDDKNNRNNDAGGPLPTAPQQGQSPPTPTTSASAAPSTPAPIPGYTWTVDEAGFSLFVPTGWTRTQSGPQVDYVDPRTKTFLRIGIDNGGVAPLDNFKTMDANFAREKGSYTRLQLGPYNLRPGWQDAAIWEFTWKGNPFNPASSDLRSSHGIDLGIRTAKGTDYAIYVASFESDWTTAKAVYDNVVANFREN